MQSPVLSMHIKQRSEVLPLETLDYKEELRIPYIPYKRNVNLL